MKTQFLAIFLTVIAFLGIPLFFIFANHYVFEFQSLQQAFDFSKMIVLGIYEGRSILDLKFQVYISALFAIAPFLGILYIRKPKTSETTHGKAKWATAKDIECFKFISKEGFFKVTHPLDVNYGEGFVLGKFGFPFSKEVCYNKPLGCLIVAPPGAGKTASVAVPNLLTLPTSCIVTDIKGELCDYTAGYRQKALKNKVLIFNPFGSDNTCFFNPFDYKIVSKMDFNAKSRLVNEVANTIFSGDTKNKGGDDHWITRAKDLFVFYALYDLCTKQCSTFYDIAMGASKDYLPKIHPNSRFYKMLYKKDNFDNFVKDQQGNLIPEQGVNPQNLFYQQVAEQKYADINHPKNWDTTHIPNPSEGELLDEIVRNSARSWANMAEDEFNSIKSTFDRIISVFKSYQVKDATDRMSFEYEDFRTQNITLYIKIAQTDIDTLSPLIRILLESIAKNLLLRESKKPDERIYFILDEFVRFGKLEFLLEMPALCRSYGVVPLFITQSYSLIKKYYSEDDLKILNEVVAYKILFKMNGADDAEMVSKEIGKYTRLNRSSSTKDGSLIFGGSSNYSLEGTELVTAQDILNIPDDEVIVIVTGKKAKPLKLKANYFFISKKYLSRIKWKIQLQEEEQDKENKEDEIEDPFVIAQENFETQEKQREQDLNNQILEQEQFEQEEEQTKELLSKMTGFEPQIVSEIQILERKEYVLIVNEKDLKISLKTPHSKENLDQEIYEEIKEDIKNFKDIEHIDIVDQNDRKGGDET